MAKVMQGISVIVCCFNSAERLPKTLKYLSRLHLNAKYPVEIIVVDNNSSDNTGTVATELWELYGAPFPLSVILEKTPGLTNARRTGVLFAKYCYGIFCDDDNWLCDEYLNLVIELFYDNPHAGLLGGASVPVSDVDIPPWFYSKAGAFAVGIQAEMNGDITLRHFLWGAGMAFRVDVLKGIYKTNLEPLVTGRLGKTLTSGDDGEISAWFIFAGYRLHYNNKLFFKHYMGPKRLTDDYYRDFFMKNYPTAWVTYSNYLTVKYGLLPNSNGFLKFSKNLLKYLYSLFSLMLNASSLFRVMKVEYKIKRHFLEIIKENKLK